MFTWSFYLDGQDEGSKSRQKGEQKSVSNYHYYFWDDEAIRWPRKELRLGLGYTVKHRYGNAVSYSVPFKVQIQFRKAKIF